MPPKKSSNSGPGSDSKSPLSRRHILVTAGEGQSGRAIIECLLQGADFQGKFAQVTALIFSDEDKDLKSMGAKVLAYEEIKGSLATELKNANVDTIMLIPPARKVGHSSSPSFYVSALDSSPSHSSRQSSLETGDPGCVA